MPNNDPYKKRGKRPDNKSRKKGVRPDQADSVVAAFQDALAKGDDPDLLPKWVKLYPAHALDLAHAASAFSARTFEESRSGEDISDALIEKVVAEISIPSGAIDEQARRSGIAFPEGLAKLLRVSPVFLERLQRYEIAPGTIPRLFAARMAKILKIPVPTCVGMFRSTQPLGLAIHEVQPEHQVSFKQALRESLSPEDAAYWFEQTN